MSDTIISIIVMVSIIAVTTFLHEFGHYVDAKKYGIYNGWYFRGLTAGIKLKEIYPKGYIYMGGIVYSFFSYPLVLLFMSMGFFTWDIAWIWPISLILMGFTDIQVMLNYKKVNHYYKHVKFIILEKNWYNKLQMKMHNINEDDVGIIWVNRRAN